MTPALPRPAAVPLLVVALLAGCPAPSSGPPAERQVVDFPGAVSPERAMPQDDEDIVRWAARVSTSGWAGRVSGWVRSAVERQASPQCPMRGTLEDPEDSPGPSALYLGDGCTSEDAALWFGRLEEFRSGEIAPPGGEGEPTPPYEYRNHIRARGFAVLHPAPSRAPAPEFLSLEGDIDIDDRVDEEGCRERTSSVDVTVWAFDGRDRLAQRLPAAPIEVVVEAEYRDCGAEVLIEGALSGAGAAPDLAWDHRVARERCPFEPLEGEVVVSWGVSEPAAGTRSDPATYRLVFDGEEHCDDCVDWYRDEIFMGQLCGF